jgi:hypothetical protein
MFSRCVYYLDNKVFDNNLFKYPTLHAAVFSLLVSLGPSEWSVRLYDKIV